VPFNGGLFCAYVPLSMQIKYYKTLNARGIPFNYFSHPFEVSPQDANRHIWSRGSARAGFYGLYFGKYYANITGLALHFRLGPLKDAYMDFMDLQPGNRQRKPYCTTAQ
jgi:hypothetical protein